MKQGIGIELSPQEAIKFLGGQYRFHEFLKEEVHTAEMAGSFAP